MLRPVSDPYTDDDVKAVQATAICGPTQARRLLDAGYRKVAPEGFKGLRHRAVTAEHERDEARAEVERLQQTVEHWKNEAEYTQERISNLVDHEQEVDAYPVRPTVTADMVREVWEVLLAPPRRRQLLGRGRRLQPPPGRAGWGRMSRSHPECWTGAGYAHDACRKPSGRPCIERGCGEEAGTLWGPMWCPHPRRRTPRPGIRRPSRHRRHTARTGGDPVVTAPKPRAWQYMGAGQDYEHDPDTAARVWLDPGDLYIAAEPLTPGDILLAPPVEVTAEDVRRALGESGALAVAADRGLSPFDVADRINERLAVLRQAET